MKLLTKTGEGCIINANNVNVCVNWIFFTGGNLMIKAVMFDMGGTLEGLYSDEKNNKAE